MAKILIVDDRPANREFLATLLGYTGHAVLEAGDGAQALDAVRAERPDLVICDVLMPTMDGYEFVRQLRADGQIARTTVIFYTAHYREREAHNLAKAAGVSHVLVKPCEPELILRVVEEALGGPPQAAPPVQTEAYDAQHLRLVTDKLSATAEDLQYANRRLNALIELSLHLASQHDPLQLMNDVCRGARALLGARYSALGVRGKDLAETAHFSSSGFNAEVAAKFGIPRLDEGVLGEVQAQRMPRRLKNPAGDSVIIGLPAGFPPVHSLLAAPITSLSHAYGWICLTDKVGAEEFSAEDEQLLTILAAQSGRIYENGSLYAKIKRHATELQQEIEERKRVEQDVRETRNFLASVFDNIPNMIAVKDARELRFVRLNSAGEKLIGHSEQELLGKSDHDFFPKAQADFFVARDRETLASGGALFITEEALTVKDGTTKLLQTKKLPIFDTDGSPKYLLAISEDITERQRATHALATERTLLRTLVDAMPDAIYTKDTAGRFTMCNAAAFRHGGLATEAEIIGRSAFDFYPRAIAENYQADDIRVVAGETVLNREEASVNAQGVENWFLTTKVPMRDHVGKIVGIVGISRDITQRKVAEQQLRESEAKYRQLIEQASDGIFLSDEEGNFLLVNSRGAELLGYSPDEMIGMSGKVTYLDDEAEIHTRRMREAVAGQVLRFERMVRRKDRTTFPAEVSVKMLDSGMVQVIFHDITQRRSQEQKIARLSRIQAVLSGINSAIVRIHDQQALFDEACRIATEHGAFPVAIIWIARPDSQLDPIAWGGAGAELLSGLPSSARGGPAGVAMRALNEQSVVIDNDIAANPDLDPIRKAAVDRGCRSAIGLPLFRDKAIAGVFLLYGNEKGFFDEEEIKLLNELAGDVSFALTFIAQREKVDYLAYYDALTGLPNRSLFFDRLGHQLAAARRERTGVALVLIDLDRFRLVNDTLGRQAGDALLEAIARRIKDSVREQDSVSRVGANRFALAISGISNSADAAHALETRSEALFGRSFILGKEQLRVLATAGVAMFPNDGGDSDTLFANAEAALRRAKAENLRFLFYGPEMNARVADSLRLENKLRRALDNGELVLWYQPKVDAKTRRISGFEALMRWKDPETGMVPPARFIPLMEQTGLILDAGRWALLQVSKDCRSWMAGGMNPPRIAVNVSPIQLRQNNFLATVIDAAERMESAGAPLEIEITESVIMENIETIIPILQTVRGLGVEIAIDDFGTGYSSLAYIARLPIQALKVDRSFVINMTQNEYSLAIVRSVISLAHSLKLRVIAEGVETQEQATLLRELDCDEMQGYLFSRPVPPDEVPALVGRLA